MFEVHDTSCKIPRQRPSLSLYLMSRTPIPHSLSRKVSKMRTNTWIICCNPASSRYPLDSPKLSLPEGSPQKKIVQAVEGGDAVNICRAEGELLGVVTAGECTGQGGRTHWSSRSH